MNSNRDPMLAPGHDGMMLFDTATDDSIVAGDLYFGDTFPDQNDLMGDMFVTSPQRSIASMSNFKDPATQAPQNTITQQGSSPEDSSEDSSSDDSARHKRKSSSMSFQTDLDMLGGSKYVGSDGSNLQSIISNDVAQTQSSATLNPDMMNEAMANDFDFESAASSPSPMKSPDGSSTAVDQEAYVPMDAYTSQQGCSLPRKQSSTVKTESVASQSPKRQSPLDQKSGFSLASFASNSTSTGTPSRLHVHPIPPKSRVETQIPIQLTMFPMPEGVESLHLPTHTISKPKFKTKGGTPERSADMLELHSMLVCTSAMQDPTKRERAFRRAAIKTRQMEADEKDRLPRETSHADDDLENPLNGGEVYICKGCITRERKRAARKKSKKPEEESAWTSDEARRVVVFNTTEIRKWEVPAEEQTSEGRGRPTASFPPGSKQIKMPMRIACYCRHHGEKLGFQVILTLKDHQDKVIGQTITDPIIITDDHKAQPLATASQGSETGVKTLGELQDVSEGSPVASDSQISASLSRNAFSSNDLAALQTMQVSTPMNPSGFSPFASAHPTQQDSTKGHKVNRSRQASPASGGGPSAKRRKANGGPKLPESLIMTKTQNVVQNNPMSPSNASTSSNSQPLQQTTTVTPFGFTFPTSIPQMPTGPQRRTPSFPSGPPTPDSGTNDFWAVNGRAQSFDTNAQQSIFSTPSSRMQSRAPSPSTAGLSATGLSNMQTLPQQQPQPQPRAAQAFSVAGPQTQQFPRPIINKIVPAEGPIAGGIEVTCLGSGFFNGLEVVFGNSPATTTTFWGETTLVCLLPPANRPGVVPVTFKHADANFTSALRTIGKQTFTYVDDEEQELFRQAFIALSQKMNGGHSVNPTDFARQTLGGHDAGSSWQVYGGGGGQYRQMLASGAATVDTETMVMRCLNLIDMDESPHPADLDLQKSNGQTMLHLAASLGYQRLVAALLARGCDPDFTDKNGFSPLHMASLRNHPQIVRRLRFAGANPALPSRLGYTAAQLTTDHAVLQMLDTSPHLRSRSFGASGLHTRASSLHSLALVTPPRSRASSTSRNAWVNDWDTSEDEDDDEEDPELISLARTRSWHQSRRNSTALPELTLHKSPPVPELSDNLTPAAAMVAWRDQLAAQIQHFQQTVEGILPHLQMPTLPTIPPLAGIPNQAPAMVRRFSSLVPQRSSRPSSPAGSTGSSKDGDHRWWEYFTGSQPTPSAQPNSPPAYDDIYPGDTERDLDVKAQAVASTQARNAKIQEATSSAVELPSTSSQAGIGKSVTSIDEDEESKSTLTQETAQPKRLRHDRNLFLFWLPVLIVMTLYAVGFRPPAGWMPFGNSANEQVQETPVRAVEVN